MRWTTSFFIAFFALLTACNPTLEELCKESFPDFHQQIVETRGRLQQDFGYSVNRQLASGASGTLSSDIESKRIPTREESEHWADWSQDRVETLQKYMARLEEHPSLAAAVSEDLSRAADHLVLFHGYARIRDSSRMLAMLSETELRLERVWRQTCPSTQLAP